MDFPAPRVREPVRWGLPDALLCFVVGILAGDIVASILLANRTARGLAGITPALLFAVVLPAQTLTQLGALAWISRAKGRGSLAARRPGNCSSGDSPEGRDSRRRR